MSSAIEPAIVLAAYAEPAAQGRRVLFIGPAISALPVRLLERGARLVHVCDPDPVRLAEATAKNRNGNLSFSALADGHFALRDGAFEVCIVEDAGITDPVALVKRIRRALSHRGVALLASLNPEVRVPLMPHRPSGVISLDYYALYDAVKTEFEHVRMLGQAPFVGYVIADFAPDGTPEPLLDTAFLPNGTEEPELFIAVASQHPVDLEAFTVVQLPYRSVVTSGVAERETRRGSQSAELAAKTRPLEVETQLAQERQALAAEKEALANEQKSFSARQASSASEQKDAALRETKLREAETKLREAETKLREAETKLREAETKVFARDAELVALRQELSSKAQLLKTQEATLSELSAKLKSGPSAEETAAAAQDLMALEQTLAERGEHVRKLERDLREAERIGKELMRQLPGGGSGLVAETVRQTTESDLAQKLAKSQADLIATRWALEAAIKRGADADSPEA